MAFSAALCVLGGVLTPPTSPLPVLWKEEMPPPRPQTAHGCPGFRWNHAAEGQTAKGPSPSRSLDPSRETPVGSPRKLPRLGDSRSLEASSVGSISWFPFSSVSPFPPGPNQRTPSPTPAGPCFPGYGYRCLWGAAVVTPEHSRGRLFLPDPIGAGPAAVKEKSGLSCQPGSLAWVHPEPSCLPLQSVTGSLFPGAGCGAGAPPEPSPRSSATQSPGAGDVAGPGGGFWKHT